MNGLFMPKPVEDGLAVTPENKFAIDMINSTTTTAVMENYASYLLVSKCVDSRPACQQRVLPLINMMMDKGTASVSLMESVRKYITTCSMRPRDARGMLEQQIIQTAAANGVTACSTMPEAIDPALATLMAEYTSAKQLFADKTEALRVKLAPVIDQTIAKLIATYGNQLDPEFVAQIKNNSR